MWPRVKKKGGTKFPWKWNLKIQDMKICFHEIFRESEIWKFKTWKFVFTKFSVKVKFENSRHENLFSWNFSFILKRYSSKVLYSGKLVHFQLDIHLLILSYEKIGNPIFCIQWHLLHYCLKEMITIINSWYLFWITHPTR